MAVYKRTGSQKYHIDFVFRGKRYQQSSGTSNKRAAEQIEAKLKIDLAQGAVGLVPRKAAPTLKAFSTEFNKYVEVRNAAKPKTVKFYAEQMKRLLEYEPLAKARLDEIEEAVIEQFAQARREKVKIATVNRALATLRKLLRLAHEWRHIDRVPRIRLFSGEQSREFVLTHMQERVYLDFIPQPLKDIATVLLDTGLRVGEAVALQIRDVTLHDGENQRYGTLAVREGKSKNAKRQIALTARVSAVLRERIGADRPLETLIFAGEGGEPLLVSSLDHLHLKMRRKLKLPDEFVLHSLRHTFLTRLGQAGADAFVICKVAGHHSITVSQRYVHPNHQAVELAVARLEVQNQHSMDLLTEKSA